MGDIIIKIMEEEMTTGIGQGVLGKERIQGVTMVDHNQICQVGL
jgi:hypothetical protein